MQFLTTLTLLATLLPTLITAAAIPPSKLQPETPQPLALSEKKHGICHHGLSPDGGEEDPAVAGAVRCGHRHFSPNNLHHPMKGEAGTVPASVGLKERRGHGGEKKSHGEKKGHGGKKGHDGKGEYGTKEENEEEEDEEDEEGEALWQGEGHSVKAFVKENGREAMDRLYHFKNPFEGELGPENVDVYGQPEDKKARKKMKDGSMSDGSMIEGPR